MCLPWIMRGVESVSGFALTVAKTEITTNTLAGITLNGSYLENTSGDIFLTTHTISKVNPSANLMVVSAVTSGSTAKAYVTQNAYNEVTLNNATVKAGDVNIYTGKNKIAVPNILYSFANTEITAFSLLPNLNDPDPRVRINEYNTINLSGSSKVLALEDVNLAAQEGIGGSERGGTDGLVLSLSLIPYGIDVPNNTIIHSYNNVNIGNSALVEAGINNKSVVQIKPLKISGVNQISPARIGTELTPSELAGLGIDSGLDYEYAPLALDNIAFSITKDTIIKVISGANGGGIVGNYYQYKLGDDEIGSDSVVLQSDEFCK